ncbi:beta strand repeat-containing protein [Terriglobus roseus]|uniref:Repeat domain-containing protein n=1 Tax=Terriglobus roseus TaxID=392734 RepID=A0A1G7GBF6_9BACT|nr:FG-GAP-like repeat-containing protein [Terriglobus roseus]SDE85456.1 Repeat domain-containing protein [Terriglobus roseus]
MSFATSIQAIAGVSRTSFARVAITMLTASLSISPLVPQAAAQTSEVKARPSVITGTDGTASGTASFQGNFTAISAPSGQAVGLAREADCSLNFYTGSYSLTTTSFSYTRTSIATKYDQTLHAHAALGTTAGSAYAAGCNSYPVGIGSRPGLFLGRTPTNINVFAGLYYSPVSMGEALYVLSGLEGSVTGYGMKVYSFSSATALSSADLNGDHVGDIVVSRGTGTSAGSVSVLLGSSDGSFPASGVTYNTGGSATVASVVDDFDGDGVLDIVAISNGINLGDAQILSFLKGKGDGTFAAAVNMNVPLVAGTTSSSAPVTNLASANLRGTGMKDIVCSNGLVLLNNTSTSSSTPFTASSSYAFPYDIASGSPGPNLALGDINKDGRVDLVVGGGGVVHTYLGKGDGTFTPGQSYDSIPSIGFVTIDDLDGDGNADIYVGLGNNGVDEGDGYFNNMSYALMGNGDGSFQGAYSGSATYNGTNIGDVNGDGIPDMVAATSSQANNGFFASFTVQLGNGKGGFTAGSAVPQPGAFSLNGYSFAAGSLSTAQVPTYALGDIDGDGKADLVFIANGLTATSSGGSLVTYPYPVYFTAHSNGDGTFATPMPYAFPQIAPAADFDNQLSVTNLQLVDVTNDGKLDLVASYNAIAGTAFGQPPVNPYQEGIVVLAGTGTGTFSTTRVLTSVYSSTTAPTTAVVPYVAGHADLNGDGKNDLIVYNSTFAVVNGTGVTTTTYSAFLSNGDGTFAAPTVLATAAKLNDLTINDFNNDGHPDVAYVAEAVNGGQATLNIVLGNGNGGVGGNHSYNLSGGDAVMIAGLAAADFDGDGKADLALIGSNIVSGVFYGNGDGTFTNVVSNNLSYPRDLINLSGGGASTALDLNKDGKPDILTGSTVLLNMYGSAPSLLATTATALTANASTIPANGSVVLTTTITSTTAGAPTGTVKFLDGSNTLGVVTLASGSASLTAKNLSVGSHSITAVYSGDSTYATSTSSIVTLAVTASVPTIATTTTLTVSASNVFAGTNVSFSATVAPASGTAIPTGAVTFTDGSTTLGTANLDATGRATYSTAALTVGSHSVVASYAGASTSAAIFTASASSAVAVTITPPGFTIALAQSTSTATRGSSATNTLSITPVGGFNAVVNLTCTGAPSGSTCTINPASVTPNGSTASTATITLQTSASASIRSGSSTVLLSLLGLPAILGIGVSFTRFRRHGFRLLAFSLLSMLFVLPGCGSSTPNGSSTGRATTANLTITATSLGASQPPTPLTWSVNIQ